MDIRVLRSRPTTRAAGRKQSGTLARASDWGVLLGVNSLSTIEIALLSFNFALPLSLCGGFELGLLKDMPVGPSKSYLDSTALKTSQIVNSFIRPNSPPRNRV